MSNVIRAQVGVVLLAIVSGAPLLAAPAAETSKSSSWQRWVELDALTLYSRYHFVENSANRTTSNLSQYKTVLRAHVNVDAKKRVTLNAGTATGATFISTWNSLGVGPGEFDPHHQYLKQMYIAVKPDKYWEAQYGSLYVRRGEEDEITSYDEDGYLIGERLTVKPSATFYLDEVVLTFGEIGPFNQPNALSRWQDPSHVNYSQVLVTKRVSPSLVGSLEYTTRSGGDALHVGVTVRLPKRAPIGTVRYEQYRRMTLHPASGFALWGERMFAGKLRVQGGYDTVDQFFGGWNADRIQNGRHLFAVMQLPLGAGFGVQVFGTRALSSSYSISIKSRVDVTINYDVLSAFRR
jgi:hypothetical protein